MLIVLEGIDGAGKTTFAEELADQFTSTHPYFTAEVLHRGPLKPDVDPLDEYENSLTYNAADQAKLVICDRWYLSEMIYGPLYRGRSRVDEFRWAHIEKFLEARGAVRLLVSAPLSVVEQRLADRGETFLKEDDRKIVHARYLELASRLGWGLLNTALSPRPQSILTMGRTMQNRVRHLAPLRTYVGPAHPQTVLVSEAFPDVPAFQPFDGAPDFHKVIVQAHRHPLIGMIQADELTPAAERVLGNPTVVQVSQTGKVAVR